MSKSKIKVIFIASLSHSGSTLLDMIMGSSNTSFSLGELVAWDKYVNSDISYYRNNHDYKTCTCGKLVSDCDFWNDVSKQWQLKYNAGYDTSPEMLLNMKNYFFGLKKLDIELFDDNDFIELFERCDFVVSKRKGEKKILIDSSKKISKFIQLINSDKIDLKVIHLVRSSTASYASYKRLEIHNSLINFHLNWIKVNMMFSKLIRVNNLDHIRISYEELVNKTDATIEKIEKWSGLGLKGFEDNIKNRTYHNMGGSYMRMSKFDGIRKDARWKKDLKWYEKVQSFALTFPFLLKWKNL